MNRPSSLDQFVAALRDSGSPLASLPQETLRHIMNEDDKSAFISWFEGRANYQPEDWTTLLMVLRALPNLFAGIEIKEERGRLPPEAVTAARDLVFGQAAPATTGGAEARHFPVSVAEQARSERVERRLGRLSP